MMSELTTTGFELAKILASVLVGLGIGRIIDKANQDALGRTLRFQWLTHHRVMGVCLVLFGLTGLLTAASSEHDRGLAAKCQLQFNDAFAKSIVASRQAADEERKADDADRDAVSKERESFLTMVRSFLNGTGGVEALAAYEAVLARSEETRRQTTISRVSARQLRAANPLPSLPDCG